MTPVCDRDAVSKVVVVHAEPDRKLGARHQVPLCASAIVHSCSVHAMLSKRKSASCGACTCKPVRWGERVKQVNGVKRERSQHAGGERERFVWTTMPYTGEHDARGLSRGREGRTAGTRRARTCRMRPSKSAWAGRRRARPLCAWSATRTTGGCTHVAHRTAWTRVAPSRELKRLRFESCARPISHHAKGGLMPRLQP